MHITNQIYYFNIFTVIHLLNIFMEHDLNILMIFVIKIKINNFDSCNVLLAIAINIPHRLKPGFVFQGHTLCIYNETNSMFFFLYLHVYIYIQRNIFNI